jgi:hypothetical protein
MGSSPVPDCQCLLPRVDRVQYDSTPAGDAYRSTDNCSIRSTPQWKRTRQIPPSLLRAVATSELPAPLLSPGRCRPKHNHSVGEMEAHVSISAISLGPLRNAATVTSCKYPGIGCSIRHSATATGTGSGTASLSGTGMPALVLVLVEVFLANLNLKRLKSLLNTIKQS